jgi:hypothetical protein
MIQAAIENKYGFDIELSVAAMAQLGHGTAAPW